MDTLRENQPRILVADDDPDALGLLGRLTAEAGHHLITAQDGTTALARARESHPDLVLLDLVMPGLNGIEVTRALKEDPKLSTIPVVILSARQSPADKIAAFEAGADDYVTKPFSLDEIDARIKANLRKRELYLGLEAANRRLREVNLRLNELVLTDEKTGLANYRAFQRRLQDELRRADRYGMALSLAMLDLDDFKVLNDRFGHATGDQVLHSVARILGSTARATDFVARYGGEEFVMLLPHTGPTEALRVAQRVRQAVAHGHHVEAMDPGHKLTLSVGIATYPNDPTVQEPEDLVRAADRALYAAKEAGKDRCVVDADSLPPPGVPSARLQGVEQSH
jgi:two-component system chemotaxis family response regulator WspR